VEKVRALANYGERGRHQSELRGHNSRLDEIQAALLRVKLERLERWNERRRALAKQYLEHLAGCPGLILPGATNGALPVWHQLVVRVHARDLVREQLDQRGIETLVHYPTPPHRSAAYGTEYRDRLPVTEELAASVISLPISPQLSTTACAQVCEAMIASVTAVGVDRPM
jgi:dTDP-4-amino-4,6-dideoxygalactose transaminase